MSLRSEQTGSDDVRAPVGWISAEVHQAEGVLCARLDISISEAAATLRRISYHADVPLLEVARDVLARSRSAS